MAKTSLDVENVQKIAKTLYKYQNFSNRAIKEKVDVLNYSWPSVLCWVSAMRYFLKTGERNLKRANNIFYDTIQQCKDTCLTPLTPSEEDKLREVNRSSSTNVRRGGKIHKYIDESQIKTPSNNISKSTTTTKDGRIKLSSTATSTLQSLNSRVHTVGVMSGDNIRIFDNEDVLKGFMIAINEANLEQTFDIVDITYTKRN